LGRFFCLILNSTEMKALAIVAFILLPINGIGQQSRDVGIDSALVRNSDLVALVKIQDVTDDKIYLKLKMLFKGACVSENELVLSHNDFNENFSHNTEYLLFVKADNNCHLYFDNESRLIEKAPGEEDVDFLLTVLPCSDVKVKERFKGTPCHRNLSPVCGCDGIVYGNVCEARNAGIQIFKIGRCNQ
jgi:hypothetical protein